MTTILIPLNLNNAKEVFGSKIKIIIDRFHVAKNYLSAIETIRKKEMKRLKDECFKDEYKKLKNTASFPIKKTLKLLFKYSPLIKKLIILETN